MPPYSFQGPHCTCTWVFLFLLFIHFLNRGSKQLSETEAAVGLVRREAKQTQLIRAFRNRFKDVPLSDADRTAFEAYLAELAAIWEDEDGI